jgi:hypothetical protein
MASGEFYHNTGIRLQAWQPLQVTLNVVMNGLIARSLGIRNNQHLEFLVAPSPMEHIKSNLFRNPRCRDTER